MFTTLLELNFENWAKRLGAPARAVLLIDTVIIRFAEETRFVTTETGYIGYTIRPVLQGDLMVILLGVKIPFVIRECTIGSFTLICTACVARVMNGEFIETEPEQETFRIL